MVTLAALYSEIRKTFSGNSSGAEILLQTCLVSSCQISTCPLNRKRGAYSFMVLFSQKMWSLEKLWRMLLKFDDY